MGELDGSGFCRRLWKKDPALWKTEPEQQKIISEQWRKARVLAEALGPFSNIFSHCVRAIRSDCEDSGGFALSNLKYSTVQDFRRIFTRYDKLARNYLASVCLAAAIVWWI